MLQPLYQHFNSNLFKSILHYSNASLIDGAVIYQIQFQLSCSLISAVGAELSRRRKEAGDLEKGG